MRIKHNLDTSVLRPLLTSPHKVKEYYRKELSGSKYITDYVRMEFLRGYIKSCIDFYFLLAMPQYTSFSEVLSVWSNKFAIREHKNIEDYIQHYADTLIYTWAKPYARIFYLDGSKKEIFIKNKVF